MMTQKNKFRHYFYSDDGRPKNQFYAWCHSRSTIWVTVVVLLLSLSAGITVEMIFSGELSTFFNYRGSNGCLKEQTYFSISPIDAETTGTGEVIEGCYSSNKVQWVSWVKLVLGPIMFCVTLFLNLFITGVRDEKEKIESHILIDAINTMPPPMLLSRFEIVIQNIYEMESALEQQLSDIADKQNKEELERDLKDKIILYCLDSIVLMAQSFNQTVGLASSRYAGNIMFLLPIKGNED